MLIAIAVVPLMGAGWFAVGDVVRANEELDRVTAVDASVEDLVRLSELRTGLLEEQNWVSAERGMADLGLSPALVVGLTGINVPEEARVSRDRVDALVAELALEDVGAAIASIRGDSTRPLAETGERYREVERSVARLSEEQLDSLMGVSSELSDRGVLVNRLRVLEAATIARQAISAEFNSYFATQFSDIGDRVDKVEAVIGQRELRREAIGEIGRLAAAGSGAEGSFRAIERSSAVAGFDLAVADLVADQLSDEERPDATLTAVLADLDAVAQIFEDSSTATALYLDLVDAAGDDVHAATSQASDAASSRNRFATTALIALGVVSVAVAVAATRAIARPIQRLAVAAGRIRDGNSDRAIVWETGPTEVRQAARALNEAGAELRLAERQALALAQGDLQHESLSESSSGSLGASLQTAVQTLTASLQERENFRRQMAHEASHDGLTQLPNRNASLAHLEQATARTSRAGTRLAVMFIDLDGFKDINDHHGHGAGDAVLRATARRLLASTRAGDHVGRLGGDEFVVIAEPVQDRTDIENLAEQVRAAVCEPIQLDQGTVTVAASIGLAVTEPEADDHNANDLLRDADLAVYRAKQLGRNRVEVCDAELRKAAADQADLDDALRRALIDHEFVLYYQPIVDPETSDTVGYEALIRWNRPGEGLVGPDDFIPFAERSDLIVNIDRWVIEAVARQIVAWDAAGAFADIPISINISGRHLASNQFLTDVTGPFDAYGIDPSRIIIEITEGALLNDLATAASKLQHLRQRGIRTAIDDFGTGYTSLAHLKTLPIDILKIDRSFIADQSATSLIQLIIDTGHLLGATVTAEGIETPAQAATLNAMGSDDLQGYLYGQPQPPHLLPTQTGMGGQTPTAQPTREPDAEPSVAPPSTDDESTSSGGFRQDHH